jgi:hypothetical protein
MVMAMRVMLGALQALRAYIKTGGWPFPCRSLVGASLLKLGTPRGYRKLRYARPTQSESVGIPMRLPVILLITAFALAGCNANQTPNPSSQRALGYSPHNPIEYAQTSGSYGGGHGGR